jgi:CRISPR-associated protein Csd1
MILQALKSYYEREKEDLSPFGYENGKIHFELVLDGEGNLVQVNDLRPVDEKNKKAPYKRMKVPSLLKQRSVGIEPNFAWDNTGYVLGIDAKGKKERTLKYHQAFKELHKTVGGSLNNQKMRAVLKFLDGWKPEQVENSIENWEDVIGNNVVFRQEGEHTYLHEYPDVQSAWQEYLHTYYREYVDDKGPASLPGFCLVSGDKTRIVRLHLFIKGIIGGKSSGASLIGFNLPAFLSYGKKSNYNAPVGVEAAFEYATALNALLADEKHRVRLGDATTVFWTEKPSKVESIITAIFSGTEGDTGDVKQYLEEVSRGRQPEDLELDVPFYILGLSPNAARISVRFWHASTVEEVGERVGQHFSDLHIERWDKERKSFTEESDFPGMWRLLVQTAPLEGTKRDSQKIPPVLGGEVMRSILTGAPYPRSFLTGIVNRIRAEQEIGYLQASIIKACLVRNARLFGKPLEVKMSLDTENANPAYLLGRLFAILEKTQRDALGKLNRTIRDGYISSASATPRAVFPRLLRLAQHHISKAEYGEPDNKRITEVMDRIEEFPTQLPLEEQGLFFIGYYHQRNAFFKKSKEKDDE